MNKRYYNPSNPGRFSSIANLAREAGVHPDVARNWLLAQDTYTLHRLPRKNFSRNRYYVDNIGDLFQVDLCDMRSLKEHNDNYSYILTCIDVFSKRGWAISLLTKHNHAVIEGFEKIFKDGVMCYNMQSDKGKEFIGKSVQKYLKEKGINYYTTRNDDTKCAVVERFNRTLKNRMWRYLTYKNTYRYMDVLPDLVKAYSSSYHRSIRMRPIDVNPKNVLEVWKNLYNNLNEIKNPKSKNLN